MHGHCAAFNKKLCPSDRPACSDCEGWNGRQVASFGELRVCAWLAYASWGPATLGALNSLAHFVTPGAFSYNKGM